MRNSRGKHSFVQFYPDAWMAGTAQMPRLAESVYFQICLYTWDKAKPAPASWLKLRLMDLEGQGERIVDMLVDAGNLERLPDGSVFSPRALAEAEKALAAWNAKSRGGRGGKAEGDKTDGSDLQDSSNTPAREKPQKEKEKEREIDKERSPKGDSSADADLPAEIVPEIGTREVADAWNAMARTCGLSQIAKMTDERRRRLRVRIKEHGGANLIEWIGRIPQVPFLIGHNERKWKANIDWLLSPKYCAKLVDGGYHNEGRGKGSAWTD